MPTRLWRAPRRPQDIQCWGCRRTPFTLAESLAFCRHCRRRLRRFIAGQARRRA